MFIVGLNQWLGLTKAINRPDMANDPRFKSLAEISQYKDEINGAIQDWLDTQEDIYKAIEVLEANRVPCAPILNIAEFMDHPHVKERGCVRTIKDDIFGDIRIPRTPLRFSEFPEPPDLRASTLGQHNQEILAQRLNYTQEKIQTLENAGIIVSKNI